jgi:hypothetical protein
MKLTTNRPRTADGPKSLSMAEGPLTIVLKITLSEPFAMGDD